MARAIATQGNWDLWYSPHDNGYYWQRDSPFKQSRVYQSRQAAEKSGPPKDKTESPNAKS